MLYLCRYCKLISNRELGGPCEDSPDDSHHWRSGEPMVEELENFLSFRGMEAWRIDALRAQTAFFLESNRPSSGR